MLVALGVSVAVNAAPPCDESKNFYAAFNIRTLKTECLAFPVWDFTLRDISSGIDHASYGEGTDGASVGPAPAASPAPSPAASPDPSPEGGGDDSGECAY